ncbi:IucA/IucC family C-terminal-domain containing protein [Paractinoplanes rishiriensis]|uniref:Aerobactin siderophore biosynthesis IucA/IucC-like C-terminal domain-containing protein n=1 Tax=Paractinoplanes rishiriensis TaxID=1050105 RepID=A0A919JYU3_9ACTN|nr:IucA/IucC family C-terminal-domain containing protein [Actinoplanes rishiriensis]GIE97741.1 hypothetical protein Ari01nite_52060 [Actinoplanes rishiriensis]
MYPLVPITARLGALFGTAHELPGLAPGLVVRDADGWRPAGSLAGPALGELLRSAEQQWNARTPAAAALAWKAYTYWLSLPAVVGLLAVRRVPVLRPEHVLVRLDWPQRLLAVGLRAGIPVAVLPDDPLADTGDRSVIVVPDQAALRETLRQSLIDEHLTPLMAAIEGATRLSRRTLLGSVAANVAGVALRLPEPGSTPSGAAPAPESAATDRVGRLLGDLGLADLVDLTPAGTVRRRTCCLAFTLPRPRICRDCCIPKDGRYQRRQPGINQLWRR